MQNDWEYFENQVVNYLNNRYKCVQGLKFLNEGGSDSYKPDIQTLYYDKNPFNIETKYSPAQAGQFVISYDNNTFHFSDKNKITKNIYSDSIINYINNNLDLFKHVTQAGIDINCDKSILINWIITHYLYSKNSHHIITSTQLNSYLAVIPIERVNEFFNVTAVLRRKKSGTRDVALKNQKEAIKSLKYFAKKNSIELLNFYREGKKLKVEFDRNINSNNLNFGNGFYLSYKNEGYFIKQKSNTNNVNVIFSLEYKGPKKQIGFDELDKKIENLKYN